MEPTPIQTPLRIRATPGMRAVLPLTLLAWALPAWPQPAAEEAPAGPAPLPVAIDAEQVRAGKQTFRIVNNGEVAGSIVVETLFRDGVYFIHDVSTMEPQAAEDVLMRLDAETWAPLSVQLSGHFGEVHVNAHYAFDGPRVRGTFFQHRPSDGGYAETPVDLQLPAGTQLRGGVIFMVQALPLEPGKSLRLNWFHALGGRLEEVTLTAVGVEQVTVPAGTFETLKVTQEGGTPGNVFYVTTESPRQTVRIDVVGQPMIIELMPGASEAAGG